MKPSPDCKVSELLEQDRDFSILSEASFCALGWDLPDGGRRVRAIATLPLAHSTQKTGNDFSGLKERGVRSARTAMLVFYLSKASDELKETGLPFVLSPPNPRKQESPSPSE
jgi:hypothetical protein